MSDEHPPSPPARDPHETVLTFLDGFAVWLADDARPTIAVQTTRLRELAPHLADAREIVDVLDQLDALDAHLDALGTAIAEHPEVARATAVEALAGAAADRCDEARALMARARIVLRNRPDADRRTPTCDGCGEQ